MRILNRRRHSLGRRVRRAGDMFVHLSLSLIVVQGTLSLSLAPFPRSIQIDTTTFLSMKIDTFT